MEGKVYDGITIMKETGKVQMDMELEDKLDAFLEDNVLKMEAKIETVFSQDEKYSSLEFPLTIKLELSASSILIVSHEQLFEPITINQ